MEEKMIYNKNGSELKVSFDGEIIEISHKTEYEERIDTILLYKDEFSLISKFVESLRGLSH